MLERQRNRRRREILRHYSRQLSNAATIQFCDRRRHFTGEIWGVQDVHVHGAPGELSRYINVSSCGSVWECPSCIQKISARRAQELRELVSKHRAAGGGVYMLTLAPPHDAGDHLGNLRKDLQKAWAYTTAGAPWRRILKAMGISGFVRALELTHGFNGWHPHLHVLIFTDRRLEDPATGRDLHSLTRLKRYFYMRWSRKISAPRADRTGRKKRRGKWRLPSYEHGVSLVRSNKDDYIAKMGLADEIAGGARKKGRGRGHRTPLEILSDVAKRRTLKCFDAVLWKEYAREMKGARQLTYSKGLRDRYDLRPEQTDLEIVGDLEKNSGDEFRGYVPAGFWDRVVSEDPESWLNVLEASELEGAEGTRQVLIALGWDPPETGAPPPQARPVVWVDPQLELS